MSFKYILTRDVKKPNRGTKQSAGVDFYIPNDFPKTCIEPGESVTIPAGVKLIIPAGFSGNFFNKSGIAKQGLIVGACIVDSDYRGEVHLDLHNITNLPIEIEPGQKITQMLIQPVDCTQVKQISEKQFNKEANTERGGGGFGSTGVK